MLKASSTDCSSSVTVRRNVQVEFVKDCWGDGDTPHPLHFHQSEKVTFKILEEYPKYSHGLIEGIGWIYKIDRAAYSLLSTHPTKRDILVLRERQQPIEF